MIIYRPFNRTVERFELHGEAFANSRIFDKSINSQLAELFEEKLNAYTDGEVRFVPPNEICPMKKGFQSLEGQIRKLDMEGGGFCIMWSLFVLEMVLNNPDKSTLHIIEKVMDITNKDPQYLRNIIRGYVVGVEKLLDETLKFLKKEGFLFSAINQQDIRNVKNYLTTNFILETVFETEKEQRDKKNTNLFPPKNKKKRRWKKLYLLMKKTKKDLIRILASFGFEFGGAIKKEDLAIVQSSPGNSDKFDQ